MDRLSVPIGGDEEVFRSMMSCDGDRGRGYEKRVLEWR
jgi:hypothetical protein